MPEHKTTLKYQLSKFNKNISHNPQQIKKHQQVFNFSK